MADTLQTYICDKSAELKGYVTELQQNLKKKKRTSWKKEQYLWDLCGMEGYSKSEKWNKKDFFFYKSNLGFDRWLIKKPYTELSASMTRNKRQDNFQLGERLCVRTRII